MTSKQCRINVDATSSWLRIAVLGLRGSWESLPFSSNNLNVILLSEGYSYGWASCSVYNNTLRGLFVYSHKQVAFSLCFGNCGHRLRYHIQALLILY